MSQPNQKPGQPAPAPTKQTVTVASMIELASTDPNRVGKKDARIIYRVGPYQTFQIQIPAEGLTTDRIKAAIIQDYQSRPKVQGLSFEV